MARARRQYTDAFKHQAAHDARSGLETCADLSRRLDISPSLLANWMEKPQFRGPPKPPSSGPPKAEPQPLSKAFPVKNSRSLTQDEILEVVTYCYAADLPISQVAAQVGKIASQVRTWCMKERHGGSEAKYQARWGIKHVETVQDRAADMIDRLEGSGHIPIDPYNGLPINHHTQPQKVPTRRAQRIVATQFACPNCSQVLDISNL